MGCNCGKPKCNGKCGCKSPAVLQINNPAEYITFHKVVIPASLGDSKTYPPRNGMYRNVLAFYEADQTSWLYSTDGIPTKLTNGITNYEDAVNLPQINGNTLIGDKTGEELGLQNKLTAGENIQISDENIISATDTTYTAGDGIEISSENEISVKVGRGLQINASGEVEFSEQCIIGFDTVADMASSEELANGAYAKTLGYYSINDGGGGLYRITNSSAPEDGGSVIGLGDGLKAELVVKNNTISVEQFGAKGDGTTDDSDAIRNALSWNGNDVSIVIFGEAKTYAVSGDTYYQLYSNTDIEMNGATVKNISSTRMMFVNNEQSMTAGSYEALKNFSIRNGSFIGNRDAGVGLMFALFHSQICVFENIMFDDCAKGHVFDLSGCEKTVIRNCQFIGNLMDDSTKNYREAIQIATATAAGFPYWGEDASYDFDGVACVGVEIDSCVFRKKENDLFYISAIGHHSNESAASKDVIIKKCLFDGFEKSAIRIPQVDNLQVSNNVFNDYGASSAFPAIFLSCILYGASTISSKNITIIGNTYTAAVGEHTVSFVRIEGSSDLLPTENVRVENNNIFGNAVSEADNQGPDFLSIGSIKNAFVYDNVVQKCKHFVHKRTEEYITNLRLENNQVIDCLRFIRTGDTVSSAYAIMNGFSSDNNIITNAYGTMNSSSFAAYCGFSEDIALTPGSTRPLLDTLDENMFVALTNSLGQNSNIRIPPYVKRIEFGGYLTVENVENVSEITMTIRDFEAASNIVSKTFVPVINQSGTATIQLPTLKCEDNSAYELLNTNDLRIGKIGVYFYITTTGNSTIKNDTSRIILRGF